MNKGTIKVLIVDDHKLVRDGIKVYLESDPAIRVVGEAGNGDQVMELISQLDVDLLLLDINMPTLDGVVVAQQVKKHYPEVKILTLTMLSETQYVRQMLQAGAEGYLLKSCSQEEFLKLITQEFSNQEIAEKLFISVRTVEVHKRNLIEKTGVKNIVGLVLYAIENGLDKD